MSVKRISPDEARELMDARGYSYLDVRSVPEFEAGHPAGAFNVPLVHAGPGGMAANPRFLAVVERNFPRDAPLVVGCRSGSRSLRAAEMLLEAGFTNVVEQRAGFEGAPGETGWRPRGLPVSRTALPGRDYESLETRG